MTMLTHFKYAKKALLAQLYDSMAEYHILKFWREYEPRKVEDLLFKHILRRTLISTANALWDMQLALEATEQLPPTLAQMEAWNRLMRIEEDEDDVEEKEMSLEEYLSRL
jgi:hypothetical protein